MSHQTTDISENSNQPSGLKTPLDTFYQTLSERIGGNKAKEVERFLKFATVGFVGAVLDFAVLNILQLSVLPPSRPLNVALATTFAFITAVASNFVWNRFWTYPDSRSRSVRRQLFQFFMVSGVGWFARTIWVTISFTSVGFYAVGGLQLFSGASAFEFDFVKRIGSNVSQLIAIFVVMIWNFFVNRYWTYSDVE